MSGVSTSGNMNYPVADAIRLGVLDTYNIATDIYSMYQQNQLTKWQQEFAEKQFDYQKELNQTMMDREDNAVQRRVADLTAAGLNPNLAAGAAAGSQSMSAGGSAPSLKAPSSRGVPFNALIDLQQRKAQVDMMHNQSLLLESQQGYYDALAGKVQEESKSISLKSDEILHNLEIARNLNLRTGDYGNSIVRDILSAIQYFSSPDAKSKQNAVTTWLEEHTPQPDHTSQSRDTFEAPRPDVRKAVKDLLQSASANEVKDFLESVTEHDVVSVMKDMAKSIGENLVDSASVIKELWQKFRDSRRSAPKMLDNNLNPF